MTKVQRTASKVAWSVKKQSAFGTALVKTDLTRFLRLAEPLIIKQDTELWTDRGMIGGGHDWETQSGKLRQYVQFDLPSQAMPIDFAGYLLALFFDSETPENKTGYYEHTMKFPALAGTPAAVVTTLAMLEEGNDYYLQDIAPQSLTLRGDGSNKMEMGGSFLASKIGGTLSSYTWPNAADLRYVWNYAGVFAFATDKKSQVRSFELTLNKGINLDLAFQKVALEANRIYPQAWIYTPERNVSLKISLLAESGDLATWQAAQKIATEINLVFSCVGAAIDETGFDGVQITIPKSVIKTVDYSYPNGLLQIDLTIEGHYDSTTGGPCSILVTNDVAAYLGT